MKSVWIRVAGLLIAWAATTVAQAGVTDAVREKLDDEKSMQDSVAKLRKGPAAPPGANETSFSPALRCMDHLFKNYGVRNLTVVIEDIPDTTKKVNVGARDMFISSTAAMTHTTHAIKLIPIIDTKVFNDAKREKVIADADYAIQGSITQFDDSMLQRQRDGAICLGNLCLGGAESDTFSGLGLDLNLIDTSDMSLVPGATVKDHVLLRKRGHGYNGDLTLTKFGLQFSFVLSTSDSQGQALRTLIELSSIELFGRMVKLPYWSCLGASDEDPTIKAEIGDWWEELAGDPAERVRLIAYLRVQMRAQGMWVGDLSKELTTFDEPLRRAIRAYRQAMGDANPTGPLSVEFLRQYLAADHAKVRGIAQTNLAKINETEGSVGGSATATAPATNAPASAAAPAGAGAPAAGAAPAVVPESFVNGSAGQDISIYQSKPTRGSAYQRGEPYQVIVRSPKDAYLYCYLLDEDHQAGLFYPIGTSAKVTAGQQVGLPPGVILYASKKGNTETVACFASASDLGSRPGLPPGPVASSDALKAIFSKVAQGAIQSGVMDVKPQ